MVWILAFCISVASIVVGSWADRELSSHAKCPPGYTVQDGQCWMPKARAGKWVEM